MTVLLLRMAKCVLRFLYLFLRPLPVRNKLVFFSRQSSDIPLDFRLLAEELERVSPATVPRPRTMAGMIILSGVPQPTTGSHLSRTPKK